MRVVITGAAGRIGSQLVEELSGSHDLCLIDLSAVKEQRSIVADLSQCPGKPYWMNWFGTKPRHWSDAFKGADVVVHLAANIQPLAPWEKVLPDNIQATWNVLEAAANHRVPHVVFASSNWVVKATERNLAPDCYLSNGPKIGSDAPPSPITSYGVSKAFGELAGRTFVDEQKLTSFVAVRIGSYDPDRPGDEPFPLLWIGTEDIRSLFRRCVEADIKGFHVVYGVSAQPTVPYDLSHTRRLLCWEPTQLPEAGKTATDP